MTDPVTESVLFSAAWPDFGPSSSDPAPGPSSDRSAISTDTPGLVPTSKMDMDHDGADEDEDDDSLSGSDDESLGGMDLDADNGDVRFSTV